MRWVALLMVSSLPLAACGGGEFTSAGAGGTSSGGAAGSSGVGGSPDGGFGGTGVAGSAGQVGTGGAGGAGGSSGAGGVVNSDCAFPAGLSVPSNPTYHSTLDSREAVRSPAIGVGEGSVISTDPTDDFIGSRCDFGVQINGKGEFFSIPEAGEEHVNIDYRRGTLMFYLTPYFDSSDNASHILFQTAGDQSGGGFTLEKAASNDLRFIAQASGAAGLTFQRYVRGADYSFNANDPIHIAVSWNLTVVGGGTVNVGIYLNGEALPLTGALSGLNMRNGNPNASLRFANNDAGDALATGLFDDIWIFHDVIE